MEQKQIDITSPDVTVEQLKALAYDQLLIREQVQANLNALQAEIQKRSTPAPTPPKV